MSGHRLMRPLDASVNSRIGLIQEGELDMSVNGVDLATIKETIIYSPDELYNGTCVDDEPEKIELTSSPKKLHPDDVHPAWGIGFSEEESHTLAGDGGRETWTRGFDYLIATIGFAVDLATIWRFPYLCYKNGGGAFLVPYFLMLFFGGLPLFYMEAILGQFHRAGPAAIWKICPMFKGVGYCSCLVAYTVSFYYNVILGWSVFYIVSSFSFTLPWSTCDNEWNTDTCWSTLDNQDLNSSNYTAFNGSTNTLAAYEFYELRVLEMQNRTLSNLGPPKPALALSTLSIFLILYFSLWKGVKSSGKVVWFTAIAPYVILLILLIRGIFLPGAASGMLFFLNPDWTRLRDAQVWIDAGIQVFYSVGAGFGVHLAYSSYNRFDHNCYRDCVITVFVNCITSVFSGLVVFTYLGYMSYKTGAAIENVAAEGPSLVFIVYPEAIGTLPGAPIWAIIFFIMLFTLGVDSSMGGMESVLTGLKDEMPFIRTHEKGREIWTLVICVSSFLVSLVNVTYGGIYIFQMMDRMAAGTNLLFGALCECFAISYFYGLNQFKRDIKYMLGFTPGIFWRICWKFISPIFVFVIVIASIVSFEPLTYESEVFGEYVYPWWGNAIGWSMSGIPMIFVVIMAIYKVAIQPGPFKQKIGLAISPEWEHEAILAGGPISRFELDHWLSL